MSGRVKTAPDAHSPSHVLTFGLLLNFLVFVACIYGETASIAATELNTIPQGLEEMFNYNPQGGLLGGPGSRINDF